LIPFKKDERFNCFEASIYIGLRRLLIKSHPTSLLVDHSGIERINVVSAEEMYQATHRYVDEMDIAIFSAAVSDFRPKEVSTDKIKKSSDAGEEMTLELVRTKDILASVGKIKKKSQFLVGFALETQNEIENARTKMTEKNLDMIVLNSLRDKGAGFRSDTNKISILVSDGRVIDFGLKVKEEVAEDVFNEIIKNIHA
jgi:phosphopantothenoylcysteine decarboxylase/phosphopantothenate--cysteine ligase